MPKTPPTTRLEPGPLVPQLPASIVLAHPEVNLRGLQPGLRMFLQELGWFHIHLFDKPLVVTSGNDGPHAKASKHFEDAAVDLRSRDKTDEQQLVFGALLTYLAHRHNVAVFDERARDRGPHWHLEEAD